MRQGESLLPFPDRRTAGTLLAERLTRAVALDDWAERVVVLALPRGGVAVAKQLVDPFDCDFSYVPAWALNEKTRADDVIRVGHDPIFLRALEIPGASVEGYLFPDTYQFAKGVTPEEMLARMVAKMRAQLTPDILKAAEDRGLNAHQLLTLASIIEREGVERSELPLISAVFWNRLKLDMPLQADPTVQYAVGKGRQVLTRADLQVDHPFNTYRRVGLPPGPIASPGRASLEAAVRPADADYLYFVSRNDGSHEFARTLDEHNRNVQKFQVKYFKDRREHP